MPKKSSKSKSHKSHKYKKHKKHKKYSESSSSSTDTTDSDDSNECEWVEIKTSTEQKSSTKRDDWMMSDSFVPTYSLHEKKRDKKEPEKTENILDKLGQSDRELNPYWKNGGTGMPDEPKHHASRDQSSGYKYPKRGFMKPEEDEDKRNFSVFDQPSKSKSRWRKSTNDSKSKSEEKDERKHERRDESYDRRDKYEKRIESRDRREKYERERGSRERRDKYERRTESRGRREKSNERSEELYRTQKQSNSEIPSNTSNVLSNEEMNALASKILKAEIMGNTSLVKELSEKLEKARKSRQEQSEGDNVVLLTNVNPKGFAQPLRNVGESSKHEKRKKKYETHADGKRVRYFEDDEKYTLAEMFEREQMKSSEDFNLEFAQLASKRKCDKDYAVDDLFMEQITSNQAKKTNEMQQTIDKQKKREKALDDCYWCLTNNKIKKHLVISTGSNCYLSVPHFQSLTDGHCLIVPTYHSTCITLLDEDVWQEIMDYCKRLVKMFRDLDHDVVFFETAMRFKYYPHMVLHCVPVPYESGNLAPIYFKKAILECEKEWAINKKLVEYKKMNVKRVIPKGLPYFMVNFGMDNGFAHVIEEEEYFPKNFAQEIIGGILDLDHRIWRKQQNDDFETQCKKVNKFKDMWKVIEP